ncbi:hypothetical protein [Plantactinospora sp. WMMB782]|uniref:hypothetical protein n=1 Tax=Plantactinospora sp. WMMB782 TaxID=3404121 RepID=UPI003B942608
MAETTVCMPCWLAEQSPTTTHDCRSRITTGAPRGGCLVLLAAVRRRVDRTGAGSGLGRLI